MASAGLRIAVVGGTGALGSALLDALAISSIRVAQLVVSASERSLGADIDFLDELVPVSAELPSWRGLDLVFLCAPPDVSREAARLALHAEVPVIDLSGAFAGVPEVPLRIAGFDRGAAAAAAPLVAAPGGPALAWALVLQPLDAVAGLVRVQAMLLDSAAVGGLRGTQALVHESLALFNQAEPSEDAVFEHPVAFDCGPGAGALQRREQQAAAELRRLFGGELRVAVSAVQVPTFVGLGSVLYLETRAPLSPEAAQALLAKAPGVELWPEELAGPSLRAASGRDDVLVGRLRADPTTLHGLVLWLASDPACLAATNAVKLAEARWAGR